MPYEDPSKTPRVELGKETKKQILDALKGIREKIAVTQHRENTPADVAADALSSGKGIGGAAKDVLSFKKQKLISSFKRKFDPLNIVHRMTGGSKLATVLAGKAMFRGTDAIRSAAGLSPLEKAPEPSMGDQGGPTPFMGDQGGGGASPVGSDQATGLLEQMSGKLTEIIEALVKLSITGKKTQEEVEKGTEYGKQQEEHLQRMADEAKDATTAEKARFKKAPTQVGKMGEPVKKEEGGIFDTIMKWLGPMLLPLGVALAALAVAAVLVYKNFDKFKLSLSLLGDSIQDLWQSIKDGVSSIGEWFSGTYDRISDSIQETAESLVDGVKSIFGQGATAEEKHADYEKRAATGDRFAQRQLAKEQAPQAKIESVVKATTTTMGGNLKSVPQEKMAAEAESLRKGAYTQEAIGVLGGLGPENAGKGFSGSPERVAIGGALTQKVAKSYEKLYGVMPSGDTEERKRRNLPGVVEEAAKQLATEITSPTTAGMPALSTITPSELPAPMPLTGQTLSQANDLQRNAAAAPMAMTPGGGGNTIINNVKNNNTNSSTVHQAMAPARNGESEYLRSQSRRFAPA